MNMEENSNIKSNLFSDILKQKENVICNEDMTKKRINLPRRWSQLSYDGEKRVPQGVEPAAGSWPLAFFRRAQNGDFTDLYGQPITFEIQDPNNFNFDKSLVVVKHVLNNLTEQQRRIAEYWGDGPPTKQWTPIIDRLIDTYDLSEPRAARVLAAVQGAFNDGLVITWYYKYLWDIARPVQLDQGLVTAICTPKFPSYPSGHSVLSGIAEVVLTYFFQPEADQLKKLAEECSISRLYGGVHFPEDILEGIRLGRHIGRIVTNVLSEQRDINQAMVDIQITIDRHANLPPPPYKQIIPFPPRYNRCDLPLLAK